MSSEPGGCAERPDRGLLFVISAPSGAGKTTLVEGLVETTPNLCMSRSYTSRPARPGEADGVDYNFISRERFDGMATRAEFLECADVFGNRYGTHAADTERLLSAGHDLVLVIDVQGAQMVRSRGLETIGIFILPPSFEILERRLRGRSQDSDDAIERRLRTARSEISAYADYDYVVVNHEIEPSVRQLCAIVTAARARRKVMRETAETIIRDFRDETAHLDGPEAQGPDPRSPIPDP